MAIKNKHIPEACWDQSVFEKLKATWSPDRIADDEEELKKIFSHAADSPLLAVALAWAQQHGIQFLWTGRR
jgi:hypothetical protein